uniref:Uncharacterized protein n=1 Tax=Fagus sylvatica TaxID=28930 RepID=A0A2N9HNG9_FAGSY
MAPKLCPLMSFFKQMDFKEEGVLDQMGGTVQLAWRNGQVVDGAVVQPFAVREVGFGLDATEVAGSSVVGTRSLLGDAKGAQLDVGLLAWVASPLTTSREGSSWVGNLLKKKRRIGNNLRLFNQALLEVALAVWNRAGSSLEVGWESFSRHLFMEVAGKEFAFGIRWCGMEPLKLHDWELEPLTSFMELIYGFLEGDGEDQLWERPSQDFAVKSGLCPTQAGSVPWVAWEFGRLILFRFGR